MDHHPVAFYIRDLETADLGCPQSGTVADPQGRTIFEPRTGNRRQQIANLLDAQDNGQLLRLAPELHVTLHLFTHAGHAKIEAKQHDPRVKHAGRDASIGHMQLIRTQLIRLAVSGGLPMNSGNYRTALIWPFWIFGDIPRIRMSSIIRSRSGVVFSSFMSSSCHQIEKPQSSYRSARSQNGWTSAQHRPQAPLPRKRLRPSAPGSPL